jgi:hypothetical protein
VGFLNLFSAIHVAPRSYARGCARGTTWSAQRLSTWRRLYRR